MLRREAAPVILLLLTCKSSRLVLYGKRTSINIAF